MNEQEQVKTLYAFLWFMLILIIAHFFAAHGKSVGHPELHTGSPLGLPRGSVRILLLAGFVGILVLLYKNDKLSMDPPMIPTSLIVLMPAGFFAGWLVSTTTKTFSRDGQEPFWFKDVEAWVAIVAMGLLIIDFIIHVFINLNISEELKVPTENLEAIMATLISFYFGARS